MTSRQVIEAHRAAGRRFAAAGVGSFVREQGNSEPVVCLHGVPASSFLYGKVLADLAARGLHGVAFDLPRLGLADRPAAFDYTWTGLGRFCAAAVDALELERFHLVVHDIGGPIGFELIAAMPDRIASLTILDTLLEVDTFKLPWSMEPFARRGIGELYQRTRTKPVFRMLMRLQGVENSSATPRTEVDAYVNLLRAGDGGNAFLKIMRGFERRPTSAPSTHACYAAPSIRCGSSGAPTTRHCRSASMGKPCGAQQASTRSTPSPSSTSSKRTKRPRSRGTSPSSPRAEGSTDATIQSCKRSDRSRRRAGCHARRPPRRRDREVQLRHHRDPRCPRCRRGAARRGRRADGRRTGMDVGRDLLGRAPVGARGRATPGTGTAADDHD